VPEAALKLGPSVNVERDITSYTGKTGSVRQFCRVCGTGLFFRSQGVLPGFVDIQGSTFDDDTPAPAPTAHIWTDERLAWWKDMKDLQEFEKYPGA
jgi:hypothetical protein